jgi:glycosyltransferase involved in cell wall biosynthesis
MGVAVRSVPWARRPRDLAAGFARTASVSSARFWDARLAAAAREVARQHPNGTLVLEYAHLEPWVRGLPAARRVLATHNVESGLLGSYAATAGTLRRLLLRMESAAVRRLESRLYRDYDVVVVVSQPDADRLRFTADGPRVVVCPNGLEPAAVLAPASEPVVAFVASFGWAPNVDAASWFGREVWPLVVAELPEARLLLVGRSPAPEVRALAGPTVEVTGTVADVAPYLQRARVAVAPLRSGGGTRLKILEALGAGRPVVATRIGAEGLDDLAGGGGVTLADEPAAMARAIVELLRDPARAQELGRAGHDSVNARFAWDATLAPLVAAVGG